jgi:hypothetical protein
MLAKVLVIFLALLPVVEEPVLFPPDVYSLFGSIKKRDCLLVVEKRRGMEKKRECDYLERYRGMVRFVPFFPQGWLLRQFIYLEEQRMQFKEGIERNEWNER